MKLVLKVLLVIVFVLLLVGGGGFLWASGRAGDLRTRTIATHAVDFPIPFPISAEEADSLGLSPLDAEALALERALERGRHLAEARYGCVDCHGEDLAGGVMLDDGPVATLRGPNLTLGTGGVTAGYSAADWDRAVRHGVLPDGRPSSMPSEDYQLMSDRELSDLVAYIRSYPPVDARVETVRLGPVGTFLVARGIMGFSADRIASHDAPHAAFPPPAEVSVTFGRHLAGVCVGCHGAGYTGGPIAGGDPSWAPGANLTPHREGLEGWSWEDFQAAMTRGVRPDGTEIREPMTFVLPAANRMTETELRAIWAFLQSLPPTATGG